MRIVLAANPGLGHVLPLLPLALAARAAGHAVMFLGGASLAPVVEHHGFQLHAAGPPDLATVIGGVAVADGVTGKRHAALIWSRGFAGLVAPATARGLLDLAATFPPDLVVHDDSEQGAWLAAERLGVPHVALQVTAWRGAGLRLSDRPLGELRGALGLPPDPGLGRWHRNGFLATRPVSLRDPADPVPPTAVDMRHVPLDDAPGGTAGEASAVQAAAGEVAGDLPPRAPGRSRVALTLGTVLPGRAEAIHGLVAALRGLDVEIIAAAGPGDLSAALRAAGGEPLVRVVGYVPMSRLLSTCDAVVFHGGSGTMMAALALGVPMVMLPVAADQHENAARCVAAGAGIALPAAGRSPEAIAAAAGEVLQEPRFRAAARAIGEAIARMPPPEALIPRFEELAAAGPDGVLAPA